MDTAMLACEIKGVKNYQGDLIDLQRHFDGEPGYRMDFS